MTKRTSLDDLSNWDDAPDIKGSYTMPQVTAQGRSFTCETGANLRQILLEQGIDCKIPTMGNIRESITPLIDNYPN